MNYITAEQFLEQPKEVQEVFMEWWQPEGLDNICWVRTMHNTNFRHDLNYSENLKKDFIPLLQMHQLIKFIEDIVHGKIDTTYWDEGYEIGVYDIIEDDKCLKCIFTLETNLLQALWQVAIQIAKDVITIEKEMDCN